MVNNQLEQIIAEKQRSGETTEQVLVDLIPDFVNEEYKTKNQRVRPESHMSTGDHQRSGDASSFQDRDENEVNDEKFNEEIEYIMQD